MSDVNTKGDKQVAVIEHSGPFTLDLVFDAERLIYSTLNLEKPLRMTLHPKQWTELRKSSDPYGPWTEELPGVSASLARNPEWMGRISRTRFYVSGRVPVGTAEISSSSGKLLAQVETSA